MQNQKALDWLTVSHLPSPVRLLLHVLLGLVLIFPQDGCCAAVVHDVRVSNLHKGPAAHKHWEHINILGGWWSVLWEFKDSREQSSLSVCCGGKT